MKNRNKLFITTRNERMVTLMLHIVGVGKNQAKDFPAFITLYTDSN
jgi:hypothetical protein